MFGKNLEKIIRDQKTNKSALCRELNITRATLDRYLNGESFMPSDKIEITAKYLGVTVSQLFGENQRVGEELSLSTLIIDQQRQINEINQILKKMANK